MLSYMSVSLTTLNLAISILVIVATIYKIGFNISEAHQHAINIIDKSATIIFTILLSIELLTHKNSLKTRGFVVELIIYAALIVIILPIVGTYTNPILQQIANIGSKPTLYVPILLIISIHNIFKAAASAMNKKSNPTVLMSISFFVIILIGTALLLMPNATHNGISVIDALFVSTSAVCVTGLTPVNFAQTFTELGQIITLSLIQIGGLGFMTLTSFFGLFFMSNSTIGSQMMVKDMLSNDSLNSLLKTLLYIILFTFVIELIGAISLFMVIRDNLQLTLNEQIYFSIFHSISAFCNAGFSTFNGGLTNEAILNLNGVYLIVASLIVLGGIGFPILANFRSVVGYYYQRIIYRMSLKDHLHIRQTHLLNLNTKIVLSTTLILIVAGTVIIALLEWNNAFASMSVGQKITQSLFSAITPRTAGFNNFDPTIFSSATLIVTIILMWIGGASQSTAGGVKINAFTTAVLHVFSSARGKHRLEVFGREISQDSISRSNIAIISSLIVITISLIILTITHPTISPSRLLFEIISAISTVGLSMNTTPILSDFGKLVITLLMFAGRIGILSIVLCVLKKSTIRQIRYPKDNIIIN